MEKHLLGIVFSPAFAVIGVMISHLIAFQSFSREMLFVFTLISYIAMIIIGIPALLFMNAKALNKLWHFSLAGILVGLFTALIWFLPMAVADIAEFLKFLVNPDTIFLPASAVFAGLMGGSSFWFLSIRGKSDMNRT